MPILRVGLMLGALGFLYVSWASFGAGFPVEVALVRGVLSFMALSFIAYLGELVVATAPPVASEEDAGEGDGDDSADDEPQRGSSEGRATAGSGKVGVRPDLAALVPASPADDNDELQAA